MVWLAKKQRSLKVPFVSRSPVDSSICTPSLSQASPVQMAVSGRLVRSEGAKFILFPWAFAMIVSCAATKMFSGRSAAACVTLVMVYWSAA